MGFGGLVFFVVCPTIGVGLVFMRRRGFTLIELLVVIAIVAMLAAVIFPVFVSARSAVWQMGSSASGKQSITAAGLYQGDYDDTFPLAMYMDGSGVRAWFGAQVGVEEWDGSSGILSAYRKGRVGSDPTLAAEPYFGDESGLGYNWGVIGSDMHIRLDYTGWPNCTGAASPTGLADPSRTVVFATSAFYEMGWRGDSGRKRRFAFFDPMEAWYGVPNVDFRHQGVSRWDSDREELVSTGNAVLVFADGSSKVVGQRGVKAEWFWRGGWE